jgi:DNA-binding transcriptional regulator YbjK
VSSQPDPQPPGTAPDQPRREAILEATLRILKLDGPRALSHRTVAKAAGVPLAATTYYFASKEEMMEEALARVAGEDVERLEAMRAQLDLRDADPVEIAGLLAAVLCLENETMLPKYEVYLEAARRPALQRHCAHWIAAFSALASDALAQAGAAEPEAAGRMLHASIDGLLMHRLATAEGPIREDELRADLERLLRSALG